MTTKTKHDENKVPKLRFPGFSGEWEEKRLGEVADVRDGTHDSPKYISEGYPLITSKNLCKDGTIDFNNVNLISQQDFDQVNKRSGVDTGDILFGMIGTIGNPVIVKNEKFAIKNVALIKKGEFIQNIFCWQYLHSAKIAKQFHEKNAGGTQKFIALGVIRNLLFQLPTLPEQQKIADFLTTVDSWIQTLESQKKNLEIYKKGMMQKLFSQEIRFKDEDGSDFPNWEEKKLGEVTEINPKVAALPEKFIYIDLESVENGMLKSENLIELEDAPSRAQRRLKRGDILFQTVRPYQKNNLFFDREGDYVASTGYAQIRTTICKGYIFQLIHTNSFVVKVMKLCTGTSYPAINSSDLKTIKVSLPSLSEQQKIADFLTSIDELIQAKQTQIDKAKEWKKGLIQQLFI